MSNFDFIGSFLGKKAQLKKDGHDLSSFEVDSSNFGVIRPVACYPVVPNEHFEFNVGVNIQTAPMREDNFARLYSNLKAVYVPLDAIQRDYLSLTQNARSTRKDGLLSFSCHEPNINLTNVVFCTAFMYWLQQGFQQLTSLDHWYDVYYDFSDQAWFSSFLAQQISDPPLFIDFVVRPTYGHNSIAENVLNFISNEVFSVVNPNHSPLISNDLKTWVERISDNLTAFSGEALPTSVFRILDSLGYGNFIPVVDDFIKKYPSAFLDFVYVDLETESFYTSMTRDKPLWQFYYHLDSQLGNRSAYPLFAYQYYIYLCEKSNYRDASTRLVTLDEIDSSFINDSFDSIETIVNDKEIIYFNLLYVDYSVQTGEKILHDSLFVQMLNWMCNKFEEPDDIDDDFVTWSDFFIFKYLFSTSSPLLEQDVFNSSQLSTVSGTIPTTDVQYLETNLVKTIADTNALYKLRQDLLRAGVRRDKQMNAIFGVSDKSDLYGDVSILDYNKTSININGLLNQAETDIAPLGQRAGRGDASSGLKFKCDTKDFGFIFIVQYFTTELFYENFMIDRSVSLNPIEWFNPNFNHLGLEPIRSEYLSFVASSSSSADNTFSVLHTNTINVGFTARDYHLKQRVNKAHGLFTNFGFAIPSNNNEEKQIRYVPNNLQRGNAIFGGFVPTVIDQQVNRYLNEKSLYYNPYMVNNLFAQMVDSFVFSDMSFDQFRCAWTFNVHKVSPMPKIGLFKLDV